MAVFGYLYEQFENVMICYTSTGTVSAVALLADLGRWSDFHPPSVLSSPISGQRI
jgi:hypothetical protein